MHIRTLVSFLLVYLAAVNAAPFSQVSKRGLVTGILDGVLGTNLGGNVADEVLGDAIPEYVPGFGATIKKPPDYPNWLTANLCISLVRKTHDSSHHID
ncbi:hypothetical protein BKA70DRAFT_1434950 [Coprinopsis sp. MPI-PUGE-AT-0042]|nr:hypothetical protein BKA70DRAFT_1434950 [Coprinopsis sp. MPI-PUGE-AT-0042]